MICPIFHDDAVPDDYTDLDGLFDDDAYLWWNKDKLMEDQSWFKNCDPYMVGYHTKHVFLFADFFLECVYYGVFCQIGDDFGKIVSTVNPEFVADDIYDFIKLRIEENQKDNNNEVAETIRNMNKKISQNS